MTDYLDRDASQGQKAFDALRARPVSPFDQLRELMDRTRKLKLTPYFEGGNTPFERAQFALELDTSRFVPCHAARVDHDQIIAQRIAGKSLRAPSPKRSTSACRDQPRD